MIRCVVRSCAWHRLRTEALSQGRCCRNLENCVLIFNRTRANKLFSSATPPSRKGPRLSDGNKRDLFIIALGTCGAFGYYLVHRNNDWEQDVWNVQKKLIASAAKKEQLPRYSSFPIRAPSAVRRYMEKAIDQKEDQRNDILSTLLITAQQSGEFFASRQWYPFEATLMANTSPANPGFVWDAKTTIWKLPNRIMEYHITNTNKDSQNDSEEESFETESGIVTKAWGKYPLIQVEEEDPYILLWLAMTPLFPTALLTLPDGRHTVLKWNDNDIVFSRNDPTSGRRNIKVGASAQLSDGTDTRFLVEFFFGIEDDLLHRIKVTSPSLPQPWQAIYTNYQQLPVVVNRKDDTNDRKDLEICKLIRIPSNIEIGKGEGDGYNAHLKINNRHLSFKRQTL